jgi:glycosyltransferase involved in cell wall biosynthesis
LVVGPVPPPVHGTAAYVRMLLDAPALAAEWDVVHLDTSDRRSLDNLGRIDATNVRLALGHVGRVARRVREERVHAVWIPVSQNAPAYARDALFIHAAHAGGARVVTHLHGGWFREFYDGAPAPIRWLVRTSSARVDRAWVLGEGLRETYRGLIPEERVRVVANGVADPSPGHAPPARTGEPTVLHLGQLSATKGVLDLIEAVLRLRAGGAAVRLVLAGPWASSRDEALVRRALADPAAVGAVELTGVVSGAAKGEVLARADVFALATRYRYEGQPLAILEAMAASLPVVATPRGAIPDTVEHEVTGLLVPEADVAALTNALGRLLADRELCARLGEGGRRRWARDFTAERGIGRVVEALAELRR